MRSLGKVVNFSPKGSIVVRATSTPRIGQMVCDNKGRLIGKIIRITGPVATPYILISSLAKDEMSMFRLSGKQLFLDDSTRRPPPREHASRSRGPPPARRATGSRPQSSYGDSRAKKSYGDRDHKPKKSYGDRDSNPKKSYMERDNRPRKSFGDKDHKPKNSKYSGKKKRGQR